MHDGVKSLLQICPGQSSHFSKDYEANVQFISILRYFYALHCDAMRNQLSFSFHSTSLKAYCIHMAVQLQL